VTKFINFIMSVLTEVRSVVFESIHVADRRMGISTDRAF
jgi:hypothetical protein